MTDDTTLSAEDQEYYARLAAAAETTEGLPAGSVVTRGVGDQPGREFLSQFMTSEELDEVARRGRGRPRMSPGTGRSPRRQVRLPDDLDDALVARARSDGSTVSAVVRAAVSQYLRAS